MKVAVAAMLLVFLGSSVFALGEDARHAPTPALPFSFRCACFCIGCKRSFGHNFSSAHALEPPRPMHLQYPQKYGC